MLFAAPLLVVSTLASPPEAPGQVRYRRLLEDALERRVGFTRSADLWSDHSRWENAWSVDSKYFTVRTTRSHYDARTIGEGLDTMCGYMGELLDTDYEPSQRRRVWIFPAMQQYNDFGEQHGAEHSSLLGSFFATAYTGGPPPIVTYEIPNRTLLMMWLTHSATHHYVQGAFGREPDVATMEGLASYFALFWDWSYGAGQHQRLKQSGGYVPLEQLLRDPLASYVGSADARFMQLGMLYNYLLNYREETLFVPDGEQPEASFAEHLRAAVRGRDTSQLGFALFLEFADALDTDFRNFDFPL